MIEKIKGVIADIKCDMDIVRNNMDVARKLDYKFELHVQEHIYATLNGIKHDLNKLLSDKS